MTDYRILSAGIEQPMQYGREIGERFIAVRLAVGKREKFEAIELTEDRALALATDLISAVRNIRAQAAR